MPKSTTLGKKRSENNKTQKKKPDANIIKKKPINSIRITSKTYYIDRPNSKGFKIGDQRVIVDSDDYPMSSLDEVNYFIRELVDYSNFAGNYKNKYQAEDANEKINNDSFFKHDRKDWYIIPVKYKEKENKEGKGTEGEDQGREPDFTGSRIRKPTKKNIFIPGNRARYWSGL
jgi:hypothetical protein